MTRYEQLLRAFQTKHYLTSSDLVSILGYRYGARLNEYKKKGFNFIWGYKHDKNGKKTNTTIYVLL